MFIRENLHFIHIVALWISRKQLLLASCIVRNCISVFYLSPLFSCIFKGFLNSDKILNYLYEYTVGLSEKFRAW